MHRLYFLGHTLVPEIFGLTSDQRCVCQAQMRYGSNIRTQCVRRCHEQCTKAPMSLAISQPSPARRHRFARSMHRFGLFVRSTGRVPRQYSVSVTIIKCPGTFNRPGLYLPIQVFCPGPGLPGFPARGVRGCCGWVWLSFRHPGDRATGSQVFQGPRRP